MCADGLSTSKNEASSGVNRSSDIALPPGGAVHGASCRDHHSLNRALLGALPRRQELNVYGLSRAEPVMTLGRCADTAAQRGRSRVGLTSYSTVSGIPPTG